MENKKKYSLILLGLILAALCFTMTGLLIGYVKEYLYALVFAAIALVLVLYIFGIVKNKEWLYKFMMTGFYIGLIILVLVVILGRTGIIAQFYNEAGEIEASRVADAISGRRGSAWIFIALSFLQVTFIPIPSTITTVVGAMLFGVWRGMLYSFIGQVAGSLVAFALGRFFGKRIIIWICGKDMYDKYNKIIRGRDKIVIIFMLLLPLFPDDLICMFAGLTTFSWVSFLIIISISRVITITYTSLGYGLIEKFQALGAWSYLIYAVIAIAIVLLFVYVWKKGDMLEQKMLDVYDKIVPDKYKKSSEETRDSLLEDIYDEAGKPFDETKYDIFEVKEQTEKPPEQHGDIDSTDE